MLLLAIDGGRYFGEGFYQGAVEDGLNLWHESGFQIEQIALQTWEFSGYYKIRTESERRLFEGTVKLKWSLELAEFHCNDSIFGKIDGVIATHNEQCLVNGASPDGRLRISQVWMELKEGRSYLLNGLVVSSGKPPIKHQLVIGETSPKNVKADVVDLRTKK